MAGPNTTSDLRPLDQSWGWRLSGSLFRSSLTALAIGIGIAAWGFTSHPLHLSAHADKGSTVKVYNQGGPDTMPAGSTYTETDLDAVVPWVPFSSSWRIEVTTTGEGGSGWCKVGDRDGSVLRIDAPGEITCRTTLAPQ